MDITIYLESKKIDRDYNLALSEYKKRISTWCNLQIIPEKNIEKITLKKSAKTYVVCPQKETISSTDLADLISNLNLNGFSSINFIILPDRYILLDSWKNLNFAKDTDIKYFAVSSFNLKGDLTAVVLSEQLYRAYTIMNNITYHK